MSDSRTNRGWRGALRRLFTSDAASLRKECERLRLVLERERAGATQARKESLLVGAAPHPTPLPPPQERRIVPLHGDELLVETKRGFSMVVPNWNVDVAIGIVRDGIIEPWTNEVFLSMFAAGDTVVNVGANFGYYALLASHRVGGGGRVLAIEANPHVYRFLIKGMFWSGVPGILQAHLCAAVAPEMEGRTITFGFDPQFIGGGNMFTRAGVEGGIASCHWSAENVGRLVDEDRKFVARGLCTTVETPGRTVDGIAADVPRAKAMLIDAEGSESYVIAGARELIKRSPDLEIILEWDPSQAGVLPERVPCIRAMWDFLLDEQGFVPHRIRHEGFRGVGHMPDLTELNRETLFNVPHSDIYLKRRAAA